MTNENSNNLGEGPDVKQSAKETILCTEIIGKIEMAADKAVIM